VEVCPGNLIKKAADGTATLKRPQDCWGCTSCLKECSFGAISFYLGADMGGRGSVMRTEQTGTVRRWLVEREGNVILSVDVDKTRSNQY
jgi:adenylylsulfate reductase subunit B